MTNFKSGIQGQKKLLTALKNLPGTLKKSIAQAGEEAAAAVLDTRGVRRYPPARGNTSTPPYYKRGVGMQYRSGNDGSSENFGDSWTVGSQGYKATAQNTASYAPYLVGDQRQAVHMARRGWRKLGDAARQKQAVVALIYEKWLERGLKALGL